MKIVARNVGSVIDVNSTFKIDVRVAIDTKAEEVDNDEVIQTIKNDMLLMDTMSIMAIEPAKAVSSACGRLSDIKLKNLIKDNILKSYHDLEKISSIEDKEHAGYKYVRFTIKLKIN